MLKPREIVAIALNILLIMAVLITAFRLVTEGWSSLVDLLQHVFQLLMIIGGWEIIKWSQKDPWMSCPECTFKIRANDEDFTNTVMRQHISSEHSII